MNSTNLSRRSPVVHIFTVKLQTHVSRADTRKFFRRMQRDMARAGLIMNHSGGFCMAVKEVSANWRTDRHLFMNWLIDQPESRDIVIATPALLRRMLEGEFNLEADLVRLDIAEEMVSRWLISKVLTGLMTRAINRLQINLEV